VLIPNPTIKEEPEDWKKMDAVEDFLKELEEQDGLKDNKKVDLQAVKEPAPIVEKALDNDGFLMLKLDPLDEDTPLKIKLDEINHHLNQVMVHIDGESLPDVFKSVDMKGLCAVAKIPEQVVLVPNGHKATFEKAMTSIGVTFEVIEIR
jgi:hypothetical protein